MILSYNDYLKMSPLMVRGAVLDEHTGDPVAGANVYLLKEKELSVTDCSGAFLLSAWQPLPLTLVVEHPAFITARVLLVTSGEPLLVQLKNKTR